MLLLEEKETTSGSDLNHKSMARKKERHREPPAGPDEEDKLSWRSAGGDVWERALDESDISRDVDPDKSFFDTDDVTRAVDRLTTAMVRAGGVGCVLKGGLNLFVARRQEQIEAARLDERQTRSVRPRRAARHRGVRVVPRGIRGNLRVRGRVPGAEVREAAEQAVEGRGRRFSRGPALLLADGPHVKGGGKEALRARHLPVASVHRAYRSMRSEAARLSRYPPARQSRARALRARARRRRADDGEHLGHPLLLRAQARRPAGRLRIVPQQTRREDQGALRRAEGDGAAPRRRRPATRSDPRRSRCSPPAPPRTRRS